MPWKYHREALWAEIIYRREKQWAVFSWAVSILLAALGGLAALVATGELSLTPIHKVLLSSGLGALTAYAAIWIHKNLGREELATAEIRKLDRCEMPDIDIFGEDRTNIRNVGYLGVVIGIGLATILSIWLLPSAGKPKLSLVFEPERERVVVTAPSRSTSYSSSQLQEALADFTRELRRSIEQEERAR